MTPSISVIIPNFNGREHLAACLKSLAALDYPEDRVQVWLADNGSTDDSLAFVRDHFPHVRTMAFGENLGFAVAINRAAHAADSDYLAFLNNDARADPGWLREAVRVAESAGPETAAIASRILSWDGRQLQFAGGGSSFHGVGFQAGMGEPAGQPQGEPEPTLFACGAAMLVRRQAYIDSGGFDEDFWAYYEDVDLGWRLWVLGYRVLYAPASVVYHRHSATASRLPVYQLRVLHIRNPLYAVFKNYGAEALEHILAPTLLLSLQRTLRLADIPAHEFRIGIAFPSDRRGHGWQWRQSLKTAVAWLARGRNLAGMTDGSHLELSRVAAADLVAYRDFLAGLPALITKRTGIQARRLRPDREILPLFRRPFWSVETDPDYAQLFATIKEFFGIEAYFSSEGERDVPPDGAVSGVAGALSPRHPVASLPSDQDE